MADVDQCILEPGGTFYIQRKLPPTEELQHQEVMRALNDLKGRLDVLAQSRGSA